MKIKRTGSAAWQGGLRDGKGVVSTESKALDAYPYRFASRFEGMTGTNPEELIATAHAGCFTMALSAALGDAGLVATRITTQAEVTLEQVEGSFAITAVHLMVRAAVSGLAAAAFANLAAGAKSNCPVSRLLNARITLDAALV
jgi:osmotically inducible protein OsmC